VEDADREQGARRVIWNTTVSLDETMTAFKGFLTDFKAKYRTEHARRLGKPLPAVGDPEKPVYEH
jgi:DNA replication licensing factor MCM4